MVCCEEREGASVLRGRAMKRGKVSARIYSKGERICVHSTYHKCLRNLLTVIIDNWH